MHNFFYINTDTCELGFHPLSPLYCPLQGGVSTKDMVKRYLLFGALQSVSVAEWGGLFQKSWWWRVDRGDATGGATVCWHFTTLYGSERFQIQWHYSHQENSYCHEEKSKEFTKTSDHYKLFLKMNISCVKKKKIWSNLWHSVNAPNKIFWIICVFQLFVHLLPFMNQDNQEFTVIIKATFHLLSLLFSFSHIFSISIYRSDTFTH
jgi:hypothetical protein